ncbi:MAG: translation elongation factor 4 [Candidatus Gygaella obscura]|nr:translation elongation factor 4 [Candidatus Gygaella obscura]
MDKKFIRNFCIIAHIDHGKSTLADRIIETLNAVDRRLFRDQFLDDMELERERGITIKASAVTLEYKYTDGVTYHLNLIDTPGHVDFSYEVSKSLAACEGALLLVDASQGIEAQTVVNYHLAKDRGLKIIPIINKIDLPNSDIDSAKQELVEIFGFNEEEVLLTSAKEGTGVKEVLSAIVQRIPPPDGDESKPLQALVFDSIFDIYKGVIVYFRVFNGKISNKDTIKFIQKNSTYKIEDLLELKNLQSSSVSEINCGDVGFFNANIRKAEEVIIGDTITTKDSSAEEALPGYKVIKPLVFCGIYPVNPKDFNNLRESILKLHLQDASFVFEPETSVSFGGGFRCGFLGLLHMEIVQERLEREFGLNLMLTTPNVNYQVVRKDGQVINIDNPSKFPEVTEIDCSKEPYVKTRVVSPIEYIEDICNLAKSRRGIHEKTDFLGSNRVDIVFDIPLAEIIIDFYDKIKSITKGYGSIDYEFSGYKKTNLVKLDILINKNVCDAFSSLVFKDRAQIKGRRLVGKLKELIPKQVFEVFVQASIGNQIIASEKIRALSKAVTAKCYGGDITRKRKLWEKQKEGKKRLKKFGRVEIPQKAFLEALRIN